MGFNGSAHKEQLSTDDLFAEVFAKEQVQEEEPVEQMSETDKLFREVFAGQADDTEEEGMIKSALRNIYQVPGGIGNSFTWLLDLALVAAPGKAGDPDHIARIMRNAEQIGVPINEEELVQGFQDARETFAENFPTQRNIESFIEAQTGLPLEAKTSLQRKLRLGGEAFGFGVGPFANAGAKQLTKGAAAGLSAPAFATGLEAVGVPEEVADPLGLIAGLGIAEAGSKTADALSRRAASKPEALTKAAIEGESPPPPPPGSPPPGSPPTLGIEAAEDAAAELGAKQSAKEAAAKKADAPLKGLRPQESQKPQIDIKGRQFKIKDQDLGVKPTVQMPVERATTPSGKASALGEQVFEKQIFNKRSAGKSYKEIVQAVDKAEYEQVEILYDLSKELNKGIAEPQPELYDILEKQAAEIERIPEPSRIQKQKLTAIKKVMDRLVEEVEGEIVLFNSIENQALLDQAKSLRQMIDFDFSHGKAKNIFRKTIQAIENAAIKSAEQTGDGKAAKAIKNAKSAYRDWTETFDNDVVNPFRDRSNKQFIKLFDSAADLDNFELLRDIVSRHESGADLIGSTQRDIAEFKLRKLFDKAPKVETADFQKALRELQPQLDANQISALESEFERLQSVRQPKFKNITGAERKAAKVVKKTPEQVRRMMSSRSGIRELKKDLSKESFNKLRDAKIREIFQGGQVRGQQTGKELFDILNKEKNFELVAELIGKEEATKFLDVLEKVGKDGFTKKKLRQIGKNLIRGKLALILLR